MVSIGHLDTAQADARLLVNGREFKGFRKETPTVLQDTWLRPGANNISLLLLDRVGHKPVDTLSGSFWFICDIAYEVVARYDHPVDNFTEGLFLSGDTLFESTGLKGSSKIMRYSTVGNKLLPIDSVINDPDIFGEGIACAGNRLYQLSWRNKLAFEYDKHSLKPVRKLNYSREGWGLCANGDSLIASDGSEQLYFLEPRNLHAYKTLPVTAAGMPLKQINELEPADGILLANIWTTDSIAFISLRTGHVLGFADLSALARENNIEHDNKNDVLNGIAYDERDHTFYITGKFWTRIYKVKFAAEWRQLYNRECTTAAPLSSPEK